MDILVTNNPLVQEQYKDILKVDFLDAGLLDVLIRVRDLVHKGHRLLTHPLSGSVKPNETPYKSVLLTSSKEITVQQPEKEEISGAVTKLRTDSQSVRIIEECIQTVQKFPQENIPEQYLNDLQTVDLSLIRSAME